MIVALNIPPPSVKIINAVNRIASVAPHELELKAIHDKFQDYSINSVSRKFIENDEELNEVAQAEFSGLFKEKFKPAAGVVKNISTKNRYACWPPHSDRVRIFALNYYIQEGGQNVTTIMYKKFGNYDVGTGTGQIFRYNELEIDKTYHLQVNKWYALSVRQAHSIENIETTRLIFTLSFFDLTCEEFLKKYQHYVEKSSSN